MRILGIHDGHNASVCLMEDGKIRYVIQEERVTGVKNKGGFPYESLKLLFKITGLSPKDIDYVGLNGNYMPMAGEDITREKIMDYYKKLLNPSGMARFKNFLKTFKMLDNLVVKKNKVIRLKILEKLGFEKKKVLFVEHHLAHASAGYFGMGKFDEPILILTNDGAGDRICATVNIGQDGKIERIAEVHEHHSIGNMYAIFTYLTGMVPLEHEYKIMGMAPYAKGSRVRKVADEFWEMFEFEEDGLTWRFKKGFSVFGAMPYFKDFMFLKRFDYLMGGLQVFTEEFLVQWVKNAIKKTGIKKLALSGGTFMNVKANKVIMELPEVEEIFVFPSCGDESNAIGVCYYIESQLNGTKNLKPLEDIYFGIEWSDEEIRKRFERYNFKNFKYKITKYDDIERKVVEFLARGEVVARFKGREEFGARALGNRSLLANASKSEVVKEINEMIKNRDFWMPFASSILEEDMERYIKNWHIYRKKNKPYYMIMTFDTEKEAHTQLAGGIHPYDKTVRPQMVRKEHNLSYHYLISEFKRITGIGGVLNTSLNLHGYPLVHKPEDAFYLIDNSSLKYLAIGNWLVEKK